MKLKPNEMLYLHTFYIADQNIYICTVGTLCVYTLIMPSYITFPLRDRMHISKKICFVGFFSSFLSCFCVFFLLFIISTLTLKEGKIGRKKST